MDLYRDIIYDKPLIRIPTKNKGKKSWKVVRVFFSGSIDPPSHRNFASTETKVCVLKVGTGHPIQGGLQLISQLTLGYNLTWGI